MPVDKRTLLFFFAKILLMGVLHSRSIYWMHLPFGDFEFKPISNVEIYCRIITSKVIESSWHVTYITNELIWIGRDSCLFSYTAIVYSPGTLWNSHGHWASTDNWAWVGWWFCVIVCIRKLWFLRKDEVRFDRIHLHTFIWADEISNLHLKLYTVGWGSAGQCNVYKCIRAQFISMILSQFFKRQKHSIPITFKRVLV